MNNNIEMPNDDDIIRIKSEQDEKIDNSTEITEFRNELVRTINSKATRYSLREIANLLIYNDKNTFDREFFDVNDIFEIIDELFIKYIKNKEGD